MSEERQTIEERRRRLRVLEHLREHFRKDSEFEALRDHGLQQIADEITTDEGWEGFIVAVDAFGSMLKLTFDALGEKILRKNDMLMRILTLLTYIMAELEMLYVNAVDPDGWQPPAFTPEEVDLEMSTILWTPPEIELDEDGEASAEEDLDTWEIPRLD